MKFFDQVKNILKSSLDKLASSNVADSGEIRSPGKWLKDWYARHIEEGVQEKMTDLHKRESVKPKITDQDLSKMLEDILEETPPSENEGIYGKKKPD